MKERQSPEQIVRKLREADAQLASGASIRGLSATRHQRGDLSPLEEPIRRDESERHEAASEARKRELPLKKIVADQAVDLKILKEVSRKNV